MGKSTTGRPAKKSVTFNPRSRIKCPMETKRTRDDIFGRQRSLIAASEVRRVRAALAMTQAQLAAALGINPRTVVRGEARGLEVPLGNKTRRPNVRAAWLRLQVKAAK
jgi:DNA-binding XRE family transcriptional regulator